MDIKHPSNQRHFSNSGKMILVTRPTKCLKFIRIHFFYIHECTFLRMFHEHHILFYGRFMVSLYNINISKKQKISNPLRINIFYFKLMTLSKYRAWRFFALSDFQGVFSTFWSLLKLFLFPPEYGYVSQNQYL